ncbi:hypothetical protein G6F40_016207 [Rhizopus arrhizus]|nr:hypothetical protein G6F40_016207 [Rhizopus arrhizus]
MDRALGGGVVDQRLAAEQAGFRTRVDDAGTLAQVRQHRTRHLDVTADVGLQGFLQMRVFQVFQPLAMQLERGIVDQDVDAAEGPGPGHRPP